MPAGPAMPQAARRATHARPVLPSVDEFLEGECLHGIGALGVTVHVCCQLCFCASTLCLSTVCVCGCWCVVMMSECRHVMITSRCCQSDVISTDFTDSVVASMHSRVSLTSKDSGVEHTGEEERESVWCCVVAKGCYPRTSTCLRAHSLNLFAIPPPRTL